MTSSTRNWLSELRIKGIIPYQSAAAIVTMMLPFAVFFGHTKWVQALTSGMSKSQ
jgi:hypothetical protein